MTIIQRPSSLGVPICQISVLDDSRREVDDLLEERFQKVQVNAIRTRSRKPDAWRGAKETFRQRATTKEKLAKPKTKRPSAYVPQESTEPINDIELGEEIVRLRSPVDRETSKDTIWFKP